MTAARFLAEFVVFTAGVAVIWAAVYMFGG